MSDNSPAGQNAYQKDGVQYVQKIIALFGGYKRRSVEFLKIGPGLRILDAGCGTGDDALAIASLIGPSGSVIGIDSSSAMIDAARARASSVENACFEVADLYDLGFDTNTFDRVRADRVFQHLTRPADALAELIRVTKPGGLVNVLDVDWNSLLIDSSQPALTRAILQFCREAQANGSAGIQLYGLFKSANLVNVEAYAETVCVNDWSVARMIWGIEILAQKAVGAGVISAADASGWLSDLDARDRAGTFFSSITGFVVRGQKSGGHHV